MTLERPYPRTFEELLEWFSSEDDCSKYLEWIRWPKGFVCPGCGGTKIWRTERRRLHCQGCQRQSSVSAWTVFKDSRKPLRRLVRLETTTSRGHLSQSATQEVF